jgi:uncharacterized protein YndB with AHSA1/START domain
MQRRGTSDSSGCGRTSTETPTATNTATNKETNKETSMETETMTERVVEKTLHFKAGRARVWAVITDPAEFAMWFGDVAELDLRVGGDGAMNWESHGRYAIRVEEVDAPSRLVWSWVHEPGVAFEDAPATRVEWDLAEGEDGGTTLRLRESGFLTEVHRGQNDTGWDEELAELVEVLAS